MLLTRTSCLKTTHANGYYGAWPGWAVSINVLPLTKPVLETKHHTGRAGELRLIMLVGHEELTLQALSPNKGVPQFFVHRQA